MKKENGITLIALIVTIIVLLILAGVSLKLIVGGDGIIGKSEKAVDLTIEATEKEMIQLAYLTAKANYLENGTRITKENLKEEIQNSNKKVETETCNPKGETIDGDSQYAKITFEDTRNWYVVDLTIGEIITTGKNGEITKKPMQEGNVDIWDLEDLQEFQALVNTGATFEGYTIRLMADVDVSSICGEGIGDWRPIGNIADNTYFGGNFEGRNHTISGIYINNTNKYQALFGRMKTGKIVNLTVLGSVSCAGGSAGVVAVIDGANNVIIENCINNVTAVGNDTVGGIVGQIKNQSKNIMIKNCTNNAEVKTTSTTSVGGIVGNIREDDIINNEANITVLNCTNNGIVKSSNGRAGGILGMITYTIGVTIEDCKNSGTVTASTSAAGGIIGWFADSSSCTIRNCSNSGAITATNYYAGGILGCVSGSSTAKVEKVKNIGSIKVTKYDDVGGIVGSVIENSNLIIKQAYNEGDVYAKQYSAAGILGLSYSGSIATIENAYNIGAVSNDNSLFGGIVGSISGTPASTANISYCYNQGTLIGPNSSKGGIVGYKTNTYNGKANYWLSTCGASYGIGSTSANTNATPLSADQMKVQTNFVGWDFDTIWKMDTTKGYPVLRNMPN